MNREEFLALLEENHQTIIGLNKTKGHDYAGDDDVLRNVRAIRHVISMRSGFGAEEEIRIFADQLARIMQGLCLLLFGDFHEENDGVWMTWNWKV